MNLLITRRSTSRAVLDRWFDMVTFWRFLRPGASLLAALLFCRLRSRGEGTVTNYTDASNLFAALAGGGTVTFAADGVITLTNTIVITNNTFFDASGHNVTLTGDTNNNPVRLISVSNNVLFTISNLKIANERSTNGGGIYT